MTAKLDNRHPLSHSTHARAEHGMAVCRVAGYVGLSSRDRLAGAKPPSWRECPMGLYGAVQRRGQTMLREGDPRVALGFSGLGSLRPL